jgi:hypothetical protein
MDTEQSSLPLDGISQSTPPSFDGILTLPPELKLMISEELPLVSRVSLALASKALFYCLCPNGKFLDMSDEDKIEVYLLLERDDPKLFACFACKKLWPFDASHPRGLLGQSHHSCQTPAPYKPRVSTSVEEDETLQIWHYGPTFKAPLHIWQPTDKVIGVSFAEAHLVMLNHHHGSSYGLAPEALTHNFSFSRAIDLNNTETMSSHFPLEHHIGRPRPYPIRPKTVWDFEHRYAAKVIDDELHLIRHHQITGPGVPPHQVTELLSHITLPICNHIRGRPGHPKDGNSALEKSGLLPLHWSQLQVVPSLRHMEECLAARTSRKWPGRRSWRGVFRGQDRRWCPVCPTDYDLTLLCDEDSGWNIMLTTYHRLGTCRTMDETWLRFMSFPKDDYKDYSLQERDTTYFDRNGMEVIPFALPYQKNYPHIPGIWRDAHFTFDRTRPINTEKGLMRRKWLHVNGDDPHRQQNQEWTIPLYQRIRAHRGLGQLGSSQLRIQTLRYLYESI